MNNHQKEVERAKLDAELKQLKALKAEYERAAKEIREKLRLTNGKINVLLKDIDNLDEKQRSILQSQIYHQRYQEALKKQIDEILEGFNEREYQSIEEYLKEGYEISYTGTMYDLSKQGIPLVIPIDQKAVTKAMTNNSKLSVPLYKKLGIDIAILSKQIKSTVSRGIAMGDSYNIIARNLNNDSKVGFNRAMRIARTEGHRVQVEAANDAQHLAKEEGADIVKQWDATLDGRTRPLHRELDGQIRELDEPFDVGGIQVMYPSAFGLASQDINCRCALLQRAKWALDDDELERLKARAEYFGLDKAKDFEAFRKAYLDVPDALVDFLFKKAPGAKNVVKEQITILKAIENTPAKVIDAMKSTRIVVGGDGSAYDKKQDILYIATGATLDEVYHEIGHLVEIKLLDLEKVNELKKELFKDTDFSDIIPRTMHKTGGDPVEVFLAKNEKLVSEYQGRIYIDNPKDAFNKNGELHIDRLLEFISEPYKEYMEDPDIFKTRYPAFYELLKEVVENG